MRMNVQEDCSEVLWYDKLVCEMNGPIMVYYGMLRNKVKYSFDHILFTLNVLACPSSIGWE